jgi:radical SAM superfamily enzyme YgiQ (UPF0313 family)
VRQPKGRGLLSIERRSTADEGKMMEHGLNVVLISTYELGRQPFGLGSPAAWLRGAGASVACIDLSRERLRQDPVRNADLIAFYVPMHTATRLAIEALPPVRKLNPRAHLCFYGLYAPVNENYLRKSGVETILGGEFEEGLVQVMERLARVRSVSEASGEMLPAIGMPAAGGARQPEPVISLAKQTFVVPQRDGLPPLARYAHLNHTDGARRIVGYTEASRGCKHRCRHCPIVPVYDGHFRIVQKHVVLEDIRQQVAAGAQHITFGDPDFFNGIRHALDIVTDLHAEFPELTYDVTIKIEHLLKHQQHISKLRHTGCLFVTSAVESFDDDVLARLEKDHTYADFVRVVELFRRADLVLSPTFVAFTPWTTLGGYCELLRRIAELRLMEQVAPIQLAIRLLIPAGSRLLQLEEVRHLVGPFDEQALVYPWVHQDRRVDELCHRVQSMLERAQKNGDTRAAIFERVWKLAHRAAGLEPGEIPQEEIGAARAAIPYLSEPWYC